MILSLNVQQKLVEIVPGNLSAYHHWFSVARCTQLRQLQKPKRRSSRQAIPNFFGKKQFQLFSTNVIPNFLGQNCFWTISNQDTSSFDIVKATQYGAFDRVQEIIESGFDVNERDEVNENHHHYHLIIITKPSSPLSSPPSSALSSSQSSSPNHHQHNHHHNHHHNHRHKHHHNHHHNHHHLIIIT